MSMNNFILLEEVWRDRWNVYNVDAGSGIKTFIGPGTIEGLRTAILFSQGHDSEYGPVFDFLGDEDGGLEAEAEQDAGEDEVSPLVPNG